MLVGGGKERGREGSMKEEGEKVKVILCETDKKNKNSNNT